MKIKRHLIGALAVCAIICGTLSLITAYSGANTNGVDFELSASRMWIDRYDEKEITLLSGNISKVSFTSNDETVVTVENNMLIAQGEGVTTVEAKSGKNVHSFILTVNDSGAVPMINIGNQNAYIGIIKDIKPYVTYNEERIKSILVYEVESENDKYALASDTSLVGVKEGRVSVYVSCEYKGLKLEEEFKISVRPADYIECVNDSDDVITYTDLSLPSSYNELLYNAVGSKLSKYILNPVCILKGEEQTMTNDCYSIYSGSEYVSIIDGVVIAKAEGKAIIQLVYDGITVTYFNIEVKPNYIEETFSPVSDKSTYTRFNGTAYDGEVDGISEEVYAFWSGVPDEGETGLNDYYYRRVDASQNGLKFVELYRKGYKYFAYDMFYTSNDNFNYGIGSVYTNSKIATTPLNEIFNVGYVHAICDGVLTDIIENGKWITVIYDLQYIMFHKPTSNSLFYYANSTTDNTSYIKNVRYYLDDTIMPDTNSYTKGNGYVQCDNMEFVAAHYSDLDYALYGEEVAGVSGAYKFTGNMGTMTKNQIVAKSSTGYNYESGILGLVEKGKFLSFNLYNENADKIEISINNTCSVLNLIPNRTDLTKYNWIKITDVEKNKRVYTMESGRWYNVSIAFFDYADENLWRANIMVSVADGDTIYLNDIRYYTSESHLPTEYYGEPLYPDVITLVDGVSVKTEQSGDFAGWGKYTNSNIKPTDISVPNYWDDPYFSSGIYFATAGNLGLDSSNFNRSKITSSVGWVSLDINLTESVKELNFDSWFTCFGVGNRYEWTNIIGDKLDNGAYFIDMSLGNGVRARVLEYNQTYKLYLRVEYIKDFNWGRVILRASTNTASVPSVAYIRNIVFTNENPYENMSISTAADTLIFAENGQQLKTTDKCSITEELTGTYAGWAKIQSFQRWMHFIITCKNYSDVSYNTSVYAKKYFTFDIILTTDNASFSYDLYGKNNDPITLKIGDSVVANLVYNQDGTKATIIEKNKIYHVVCDMSLDRNPNWYVGYINIFNSCDSAVGATAYVSNISATDENPYATN